MSEDTLLPFDLPSVARKKLSIGFDGGQLSSNAGVILLRGVEKKLELAARLAACIRDRRKPERIEHPLEEMLRLRMFAIAAGYEDADDCDSLRYDPIFKMASAMRRRAAILCARSPPCRGWRMRRRRSRSPDRWQRWWMGSAKATGARRPRSRSTSTIPAIRCMAISSSRY